MNAVENHDRLLSEGTRNIKDNLEKKKKKKPRICIDISLEDRKKGRQCFWKCQNDSKMLLWLFSFESNSLKYPSSILIEKLSK